jgi:predicted RNA-binding protein
LKPLECPGKTLNVFVRKRTIHHKNRSGYRKAWNYAEGSRGDVVEVIVEALSNSIRDYVIVVQNNNPTFFVRQLVTVKNVAIIRKAGNPQEYPTRICMKRKTWPKK